METLSAFDYQLRTRVVFGPGTLARLGGLCRDLGGTRVLIVTDSGIVKAGHTARARALMEAEGVLVSEFDDVQENPTNECVRRCAEFAKTQQIDLFVALGGGSSLDTAKGANFILTNGGQMKDYWGYGKATRPMLPLIAIPTTAGTGSECQSYALISDDVTHQKMACGDPKAAAKVALLDPELTLSQPPTVTACTGIDALAHAVESAVTRKRNPVSSIFSREAFRLIARSLATVLNDPGNLDARASVQLGAAWAGTAIENSMLGAAHSAANPLTAHFGIVHGHAVGIMLSHVIRLNSTEPSAAFIYNELQSQIPPAADGSAPDLPNLVHNLLSLSRLETRLSALGVEKGFLPTLAQEAARQWTAQFNPAPVDESAFLRLYECAF